MEVKGCKTDSFDRSFGFFTYLRTHTLHSVNFPNVFINLLIEIDHLKVSKREKRNLKTPRLCQFVIYAAVFLRRLFIQCFQFT